MLFPPSWRLRWVTCAIVITVLRPDRALFGSPDSIAIASDPGEVERRAGDLAVLGRALHDLDGIGRGEPQILRVIPPSDGL